MSIAISSVGVTSARSPEAKEGPGPDRVNDGDADDGVGAAKAASAPAPSGMGKVVDKTA
jgi:hypothetical protein